MLEVITCMLAGAVVAVPLAIGVTAARLSCHKVIETDRWRAEYRRGFWSGTEEWHLEYEAAPVTPEQEEP
jgi:hypothetical protein